MNSNGNDTENFDEKYRIKCLDEARINASILFGMIEEKVLHHNAGKTATSDDASENLPPEIYMNLVDNNTVSNNDSENIPRNDIETNPPSDDTSDTSDDGTSNISDDDLPIAIATFLSDEDLLLEKIKKDTSLSIYARLFFLLVLLLVVGLIYLVFRIWGEDDNNGPTLFPLHLTNIPSIVPSQIPSSVPTSTSHPSAVPSLIKVPSFEPTPSPSATPTVVPTNSWSPTTRYSREPFKLVSPDGSEWDPFGDSIAVSDGTILVGASQMDGGRGAIYQFFVEKDVDMDGGVGGGEVRVTFLRKLVSPTRDKSEQFGLSVAVNNNVVVVGSDGLFPVYVFNVESGELMYNVTHHTKNPWTFHEYDHFGHTIAVSDDVVIVGATSGDFIADSFVYSVKNGEYLYLIPAPRGSDSYRDYFCGSFAVSPGGGGDTVVVGNPYDNHRQGSVYVFSKNGANFQRKLESSRASASDWDWFGRSVAVCDYSSSPSIFGGVDNGHRIVVVGAPFDDNEEEDNQGSSPTSNTKNTKNSGSVYVFFVSDTEQKQLKLTAPEKKEEDYFGWTVACSRDTVAVTSRESAYMFSLTTGEIQGELNLSAGRNKLLPSSCFASQSVHTRVALSKSGVFVVSDACANAAYLIL